LRFQARGNILRRTIVGGVENAANREEQIQKRDIRLTKIAVTIVCVFVTCHMPRCQSILLNFLRP
jgi:hypothetical protein